MTATRSEAPLGLVASAPVGLVASAPSNIALIKYMGKADPLVNRPANSSLSFTLDNLRTFVRIRPLGQEDHGQDVWAPLEHSQMVPLRLNEKSQLRFLAHFRFLKEYWNIKDNFLVESANNFPSDCGLASSASSFAALTTAAAETFFQLGLIAKASRDDLAKLSRQGSGSSIRSFYRPWSIWNDEGARAVEFTLPGLRHQVLIIDAGKKSVSSSQAHRLVVTSPLFAGRAERAERRLENLCQALRAMDWRLAFQITWDEFQDMHDLFETSTSAFTYRGEKTKKILAELQEFWRHNEDGPLVTMDAGANVHLIWRADQQQLQEKATKLWQGQCEVMECSAVQGELN